MFLCYNGGMNGNEKGTRQNAKEMTAEIDRLTDMAKAEAQQAEQQRGLERERAGSLGGKVLTYNPEQGNRPEELRKTERVVQMAERDNGFGAEYREGISIVGEESEKQIQDRASVDRENAELENLKNENFPGIDNDAKIVARSQEERGGLVAQRVEKLLSKKADFSPSELERWFGQQRDGMLLDFEVPRRIGDRN